MLAQLFLMILLHRQLMKWNWTQPGNDARTRESSTKVQLVKARNGR
jgi:hypothetical protein